MDAGSISSGWLMAITDVRKRLLTLTAATILGFVIGVSLFVAIITLGDAPSPVADTQEPKVSEDAPPRAFYFDPVPLLNEPAVKTD